MDINRALLSLALFLYSVGMLSGQQIQCYSLEDGLPQSQVNDIIQDAQGYLWIATNGGGVCRFDGENFELMNDGINDLRIKTIDIQKGQLFATDIYDNIYLFVDQDGLEDNWILDTIDALSIIEEASRSIAYLDRRINKIGEVDRSYYSISRIQTVDRIGSELWVGTRNDGIYVLSNSDLRILDRINTSDGLPANEIHKIYQDRQGIIWIGTIGGGLCKYVQSGFNHIGRSAGLEDNEIDALVQKDGSIYTANGVAGIFRIEEDKASPIVNNAALRNQNITALAIDQYQRIWASTADQGIIIIDDNHIDYFNVDNGLISNQITDVIYSDRSMWIASAADGIQHIRVDTAYATYGTLQYYAGSEGISDLFITDILLSGTDIVYTTAHGSVGRISDGQINHVTEAIGRDGAILTGCIRNDKVYVGTAGRGIYAADIQDLNFTKLAIPKTNILGNIHQLEITKNNTLWAGSKQGVAKLDIDAKGQVQNIEKYGYSDGFVGVETRPRAILAGDAGQLWFGTMNGLTRYQPINASMHDVKPQLIIASAEVDYIPIDNHEKYSLAANQQIVLEEDQNNLSFTFKSIDLLHSDAVQYRWKINFNDWSPWNTDRKVILGNLDYGQYRFQVQAMNKSGNLSEIKDFNFKINTPLYKQAWLQVLALFGLLFLGFGLLSRYLKRVNHKAQADQKALQQENYLLSLEQKALQLQMNPHFIFNVLNNIKALSLSDPQKSRSVINDFAVLLRSILENSRSKTITLENELKTLRHYLQVELFMAKRPFEYAVNVADDLNIEETMIPPMLIQPFVENAIHHGLAAVKREGKLTIDFEAKGRYLHCTIVDNGIGIEESRKMKTSTSHNSVALAVTTDRIKSLDTRQSITIEQLTDEAGKSCGTRVSFSIPHVLDY